MSLVEYSLRTKGGAAFARRLWTVFARFGVTARRTRRSIRAMRDAVRAYGGEPTFFIPATVLARDPSLIRRVQRIGVEIGVHGYVHNDYRSLPKAEQSRQIQAAMALFKRDGVAFRGFRNPYLGWNEHSLELFRELGFDYDSNEAVIHDVVDRSSLPPAQADSLARSLTLFQAIPPTIANLRPHTEAGLARIPTSIPDDEMLFDRMRLPVAEIGAVWSEMMGRVFDAGGVFVLNLHPERGVLAASALRRLLAASAAQAGPVWVASLRDIVDWWRERAATHISVTPEGSGRWRVALSGSPRASLVVRNVTVEERTDAWAHDDYLALGQSCAVTAETYPGVALSPRTSVGIEAALREQGYPIIRVEASEAARYATWLDLPDGLGATRRARQDTLSALVERLERGVAPLARLGVWPGAHRAALSITGDIDSITIQDFFLRILEVRRHTPAASARTVRE